MIERVDLNEFVNRVNQLAPLPAVALRVLQLAEDQRTSAADLASVIATDQAMTAKLLRLANSAYFAAGREITTVRDAIVLLGMVEIRRLVLTTALMGQFTGDPGTLNVAAFWGHALAVGMVAEVMARNTGLATPEEAFTAGILHDIGKLVMVQYLKEHFDAAATFATTKGVPLHRAEAEVFGFDHPMLGRKLAEVWRLPQGLVDAIAHHHVGPGQDLGLSHVVAQANDLCRDHGLWCGFEDMEPGASIPDTRVEDPIRAAALAKLGGFDKVVERANSFLQSSPAVERRSAPAPRPIQDGNTPRTAPWAVSDRFPDRSGPFRRRA
jgi:putative nucleotidyltransferase with HDIG domain